ncbi:12039_t:CDS:2, partial [Cetraspora pellucida]
MRATARRFEIEQSSHQTQFPLLEKRLVEWINECYKEQNAVTRNMVEKKAKALAQTNKFKDIYLDI